MTDLQPSISCTAAARAVHGMFRAWQLNKVSLLLSTEAAMLHEHSLSGWVARGLIPAVAGVLLAGCSSAPPRVPTTIAGPAQPTPISTGDEIAMRALAFLGTPDGWGGGGRAAFDCSGLVRFIHAQLGIPVPRTAAEQFAAATPVRIDALVPGDLLFFRIHGAVSHVAIYAGEGRFIHAPQTGKLVELRLLDDPFYGPKLVSAGRLF